MLEQGIPFEQSRSKDSSSSSDRGQEITPEMLQEAEGHYYRLKSQIRETMDERLDKIERCNTDEQAIKAASIFASLDREFNFRYTFDSVVSRLERRGIQFDLERLKTMMQSGNHFVQFFSVQLARTLTSDAMDEFLSYIDANYSDITKKGIAHFRLMTEGQCPEILGYAAPFHRIIGDTIARQVHRNDGEKRTSYESKYLHILQQHITDTFTELQGRDDNVDFDAFILHLSSKRAPAMATYPQFEGVEGAIPKLKDFGSEKTITFAEAWIHFYPYGCKWQLGNTLSAIDPDKTAHTFLPLLKSHDRAVAQAASTVLDRLEFGRIGITEEGVRYLEKTFDLGEHNNPSYFVERLTTNGELGIFNKNQKLINFFRLEGLDSDEATIRARVLEFTYQTLFTPRENETPEERAEREQHLRVFQENYFGFYNDVFFQETGVRFNDFSFKEQGQLLLFYKGASEEEKKRTLEFVRQYREDGFCTFLSLEHGREMGNAILTIGEQLPQEAAERVFAKYSEIVRATEDVQQYVREQFGDQLAQNPAVIDHVVENLSKRGKDLLVRFANEAESVKKGQRVIAVQDILTELARIKTDILLFVSAFRVVAEEGTINLETLRDTSFVTISGPVLLQRHPDQVAEMKRMYAENYQNYPREFRDALLEGFDKALQNPLCRVYALFHKNEITTFCRFDEIRDFDGRLRELYFGSFNTATNITQSKIGMTVLSTIMEQEQRHGVPIIADCDPKAPITKSYLRMGFEKIADHEVHGVPSIRIRLKPDVV